jgi:chemotaxis protein histidine kinase CheA
MSAQDPADIYCQATPELPDQLQQPLLDLERNPADAGLVNPAFRARRTIEVTRAMLGSDRVAASTHHVETALKRRSNRIAGRWFYRSCAS